MKVCKICGKEYKACSSCKNKNDGVYRWQDVACCPEHGAMYLKEVLIARGELAEDAEEAPVADNTKKSKKKSK